LEYRPAGAGYSVYAGPITPARRGQDEWPGQRGDEATAGYNVGNHDAKRALFHFPLVSTTLRTTGVRAK
jgi:hypothetical protein